MKKVFTARIKPFLFILLIFNVTVSSNLFGQPGDIIGSEPVEKVAIGWTTTNTTDAGGTAATSLLTTGDVNGDGSINIIDAMITARYSAGLNPDIDLESADVNCDGNIDIIDALVIARYSAGLINQLPCGGEDILTTKTNLLNYISSLSTDTFNGTIAGQNCYHGSEILGEESWVAGYPGLVEELYNQTGKWVGIIGVDYEFQKLFTPGELSRANQVFIDYWNAGGLITINLAPHNPWINDESDLIGNPGTWDGPGNTKDKSGVTSLNDLIDPSKEVHQAWMRKLGRVADGLEELKEAGVVVLWRPLQEMNGNWFWWGMASHPDDPSPYINLYRHMHDYFTNTRELTNLIWLYSPADSYGQNNSSSWNRTVDWAYPGDEYVDIVAGTVYNDQLNIDDYETYKSLGKPMGMGEYGPAIGGLDQTGGLDTRLYAERIKNDYPRVAFWISWHSYPGAYWSLITNQNYNELMNNPDIITREDINF